jgi:hypothetical protein
MLVTTSVQFQFWNIPGVERSQAPGIAALQLQRQLGSNATRRAWMMLHKLRRAMVVPERSPLTGVIEVDEAYMGPTPNGMEVETSSELQRS